jgi:hypothetical protein
MVDVDLCFGLLSQVDETQQRIVLLHFDYAPSDHLYLVRQRQMAFLFILLEVFSEFVDCFLLGYWIHPVVVSREIEQFFLVVHA